MKVPGIAICYITISIYFYTASYRCIPLTKCTKESVRKNCYFYSYL